jgi:O-antigen/teichoic acid export membrane protein
VICSINKDLEGDAAGLMSDQFATRNRLSIYLKALSSNYALLGANIGSYGLTVPLFLRWLGPEQYGIWLIFLQLVYLVSTVTLWVAFPVVREAAACYVEVDKQRTQRLFQTVSLYYAFLGTVVTLLMILASRFVPWLFKIAEGNQTEVSIAFLLLSMYISGIMQLNLLVNFFNGFQQMHISNMLLGMQIVLNMGLSVTIVAVGTGLAGLAAGQVLAIALVCSIGWSLCNRMYGITWGLSNFSYRLLRTLLRAGTFYGSYCIAFLFLQCDILLVGVILGPIHAAAYGIAYKLMDYIVQVIWKIPDSLLPTIAELDARKSRETLYKVHRLGSKVAVSAAFLFAIVIAVYGRSILLLWIGMDGVVSQPVLVTFGLLIILQALIHSSLMISFGTNQMDSIAKIALIEAIVKIVLSLVLLPWIGVIGVAIGTFMAQSCLSAWYVPLRACIITSDKLSSYLREVVLPALPAAFSSCLTSVISSLLMPEIWLQLVVGGPTTVGVYLFIYLSRGINREERRWMVVRLQRIFQY